MGTDQVPPVNIAIVGTETHQGGGVAPTPSGTIAITPDSQPNLKINVITPAVAIAVRAANLFLTTFLGLLTAAGVGVDGMHGDFQTVVSKAAMASLIVAGLGTVKNIVTVLGRLEGKYPLATGSI